MDNTDFNDRISKLLSGDKKTVPQETDDELAQRFNKVFAAEPIAKQQNLSYHVPDSAYTDVDDEIARMLQEEEEDDDDDDLIYGALSNEQDKDLVTEAEEKVSGVQSLFLGSDFGTDESDALIRRIQEENALDSKYETFAKARSDEFESRVHALKKGAPSTDTPSIGDERPGGSIPKPLLKEDLHDEMDDWCTLCNEDATVECLGCDHDKYCGRCFYETHQSDMADYDATTHKSKVYAKR